MIRYQIRALRGLLPKVVVSYSTSISSIEKRQFVEERKSVFIQQLLEEFQASKGIILKLKKQDAININFNVWKSHIHAMMKYGLSEVHCFEMILKYPSLLEIPFSKLEDTLMHWYLAFLRTDTFQLVLRSEPLLLEVDADVIKKRMPQLLFHFHSHNAVAHALTKYPNIMFDNWVSVIEKIDYLLKKRNFKIRDVLESDAFSESLDFIKFRLDLLEKCGIYIENTTPIHKINKYDKSGHQNPPLKDILHKHIKDFVKIAKISEEEYLVSEEMYMADDEYEADGDEYDLQER